MVNYECDACIWCCHWMSAPTITCYCTHIQNRLWLFALCELQFSTIWSINEAANIWKKWPTMTTTICMQRMVECGTDEKRKYEKISLNSSEKKEEDSSLPGRRSRRLTIRIRILITYFSQFIVHTWMEMRVHPYLRRHLSVFYFFVYLRSFLCFIVYTPCPVSLLLWETRGTLAHTFLFS